MSDTKKKTAVEEQSAPTAEEQAEKILADARTKAAAIVAEAEAQAAAQAENRDAAAEPPPDPMEELVDYTAPLLPDMKKRDILVGVNGETVRIQRGVPVKIKRKFYNALQYAARQEFAAYESREEIKRQSAKPLASM